jgi:hypothetical protein
VIREGRFVLSRRPYAVDLGSLHIEAHQATYPDGTVGHTTYHGRIGAVWYRRRRGVTVACIGTLWDIQRAEITDPLEWLAAHDDGRYGGDCEGRWDGAAYWGNVPLAVQEQHLAVLRPMLDNYPTIPAGHSGWWRF